MTTLEEFVAYEPVDEAIVMELRDGTGDGPDNEDFMLDFSTGLVHRNGIASFWPK